MLLLVLAAIAAQRECPDACDQIEEAAHALKAQPKDDRKKYARQLQDILEDAAEHGDDEMLREELEAFIAMMR